MKSTIFKIFTLVAVFGAIHSLLATRAAKDQAARWFGEPFRNALYRPFFNLQSVVLLGMVGLGISRLSNRVLYETRGLLAACMRAGQLMGLLYAVYTAAQVGILRITGLQGLLTWLRGERSIPMTPEAQGPALDPDTKRMKVSGPFRFSRHPLNFAPLPIFWLFPRMTLRLAAFSFFGTLYLILGSIHEEARLRGVYGRPYEDYRQSGIPFYFPRVTRSG